MTHATLKRSIRLVLAALSISLCGAGCGSSFEPGGPAPASDRNDEAAAGPVVSLGGDQVYSSAASAAIVSQNQLRIKADVRNQGPNASFVWTQLSGPRTLTFAPDSRESTTVGNLTFGTFEVQLRVSDGNGNTGEDRFRFTLTDTGATPTPTPPPTPVPVPTATPKPTPHPTATPKPPTPTATPKPSPSPTPASGNKPPVIVMSATGKLTARPRTTVPRPTDYVGSGEAFGFQGAVVDDGKVVDCKWSQLSGPTQLTFTQTYLTPEPDNEDGTPSGNAYCGLQFTNYIHGTYKFKIEATDDKGLKAAETVELTFPVYSGLEKGLQIMASPTGEQILPPNYAKFMFKIPLGFGVGVKYYSEGLRDYDIRQIAGPNVSGVLHKNTQYGFVSGNLNRLQYGTYTYEFEATGTDGTRKTDTMTFVFVKPQTPTAPISVSEPVHPQVYSDRHGDVVFATSGDIKKVKDALNVCVYYDSSPTAYNWRQIDGPTQVNFSYKSLETIFVSANVENLDYGTYTFEGSLSDENGRKTTEILKVTHPKPLVPTGVNQAPQVTLSASGAITARPVCYTTGPVNQVESGKEFAFQGVAYDDGQITSSKWTQLSGPTALKITPTNAGSYYGVRFTNHTYGTYELKLEVTDDKGLKGSDTIKITFPKGL